MLNSRVMRTMKWCLTQVEWSSTRPFFLKKYWGYSIYAQAASDSQEELSPDMTKPRGKGMDMKVYVDSDHAGDTVTHTSITGFVILINDAPIYWNSKKQTSCETNSFVVNYVL